jgi:uncharacterized protein (DUF1501 family)
MSNLDRRAFLRHASALAGLGAAAPLGLSLATIGQAAAQSSQSDYRALVCVFLPGGNDAYNTMLATDADSWPHYANHRNPSLRNINDGSPSIALMAPGTAPDLAAALSTPERLGGVLPIAHSATGAHASRQFALHPMLGQLHSIHGQGRLAVLANVGPLKRPLSKADYEGVAPRPAKLFSHNDQQSTWQSFSPEGADAGWGGRMGDLLMSLNGTGAEAPLIQRSFTCMAPGNQSLWLAGQQVRALQTGVTGLSSLTNGSSVLSDAGVQQAMLAMMGTQAPDNLFAADHQATVLRAVTANTLMGSMLGAQSSSGGGNTPWATAGQFNPWVDPMLKYTSPIDLQPRFNYLSLQLQMVARLIDANRLGGLGIKRQVFMVTLGGFDLHDNHNRDHADRLAQLDHGLAYFDRVLSGMPSGDMRQQVTTFTASEFGRSLTSNGDGTDHGWGSHHFIMGGAVSSADVYGRYPQLATANAQGVFDSPDLIQNGVMLPSTSVDQYANTLGRWMGVSDSNLLDVLPNLKQFDASSRDLGFLA